MEVGARARARARVRVKIRILIRDTGAICQRDFWSPGLGDVSEERAQLRLGVPRNFDYWFLGPDNLEVIVV